MDQRLQPTKADQEHAMATSSHSEGPSVVAVVFMACLAATGLSPAVFGGPPEFRPKTVIDRVFPTIINPPTLPAGQAASKIEDNDLVLGVTVGGASRAYPINMLTGPVREIINDELGGRYIAATW
jgi:hypothetical protein